ncbi:MAG: 3-deoxy-D-manno-octulosonic acid transferase [Candidatus Omnitrophica bacterium]|nr:3-deoxy-D-manno-octulosonic acid transferase [Candidatus Omnitrophota bacterium]
MTWIYSFAFLIFVIFSIPKFLIRLGQATDPRQLVRERFGLLQGALKKKMWNQKVLWLHAVSVGEVMAARQWIQLFLAAFPDWVLVLSVTTPTGHEVAQSLASERVFVFYAPFDFKFVVRRVLNDIQPQLILLMETEIWPNLISEAHSRKIPIGIINGRISPRSFRRYQLARFWMAPVLEKLSFCLVQSERDGEYFLKLGMPDLRIFYTGNMKFDQLGFTKKVSAEIILQSDGQTQSPQFFVGGSTHWNEEEMLLRVFARLRGDFPNLRLILAPRHPEKLSKVIHAVKRSGFECRFFSQNHSGNPWQVFLIDRMGVLASLYTYAHVVFIGGSFTRRGGQNPIEAALAKKPILYGPNVFNFEEVYGKLERNGAAIQVNSEEELFQKSKMLLSDPRIEEQMGTLAWTTVQSLKGATVRTLDYLASWIHGREPSVALVNKVMG